MQDPHNKLPPEILEKANEKLTALRAKLEAKDPMMAQHLRESHSLLQSFPETVYLLDDSEIKLLLDAAQEYTKIKIVEAASKPKSGAGSRKAVNVDDL
jgi:hypothetical protein